MTRLRLAPAFLLTLALAAPAPAQTPDARLSAEIDALEARVARLEGHREVRKLQRAFGYYVDRGLWRQAAQLFARQGTLEIGQDGIYVGPARIEAYLRRLHGGQDGLVYGQLNEWITLQPAISVAADGQSARARWRDLGMLGQYKDHAEWRDGIYENGYVVEDGVWKIASLTLTVNFVAPYASGWARLREGNRLEPSAAARAFPPDRPPSRTYAPFPAVGVTPFALPNPVTGRAVETGE